MKTVLVTGGSGFIGSHLIKQLSEDGHRVVNYDYEVSRMNDITNSLDPSWIIKRSNNIDHFDVVVHLAAYVSAPKSIQEPMLCYETNVGGLLKILKVSCDKFIFASSAAVYGGTTPYAITKTIGEQLVMDLHDNYAILRFFNVYGPKQNPAYGAVISAFLDCFKNNTPYRIDGDGLQVRDFIHVDDVVSAIIFSMGLEESIVSDVSTGETNTIRTLQRLFSDSEPLFEPERNGDIRYSISENNYLKELGWSAKIDLETGIEQLKNHG